jgi:hypothetical protein
MNAERLNVTGNTVQPALDFPQRALSVMFISPASMQILKEE